MDDVYVRIRQNGKTVLRGYIDAVYLPRVGDRVKFSERAKGREVTNVTWTFSELSRTFGCDRVDVEIKE